MGDLKEKLLYPRGRLRGIDGERLLISYPLPFDEAMGNLRVPKDLTLEEAERIKSMIDSLVVESNRERSSE